MLGGRGASLFCTYWLVSCLATGGRREAALAVFERANAYANDLGLLAEQAEPATGELMGNFPHALSHADLVNAARVLAATAAPPATPLRSCGWVHGLRCWTAGVGSKR